MCVSDDSYFMRCWATSISSVWGDRCVLFSGVSRRFFNVLLLLPCNSVPIYISFSELRPDSFFLYLGESNILG